MVTLSSMAVKEVLRMGHPTLRKTATPLKQEEFNSPRLKELLVDMSDTMKAQGGIGIAAPQIGESVQVAIIEIPDENRYQESTSTQKLVLINPEVEILDAALQGFWEGCLSVPGLRGFVERPQKIRVTFQDESGQTHQLEAQGFLATVFQHELDHLFGTLYIDKIKDPRLLSYNEEFIQFHQNETPKADD